MKSKIQILKEETIVILALIILLPVICVTLLSISSDNTYGSQIGALGTTGNTVVLPEDSESEDIIYVSTEEDLRALANNVNNGNSYANKEIILLNDITVSGRRWVPIGNAEENQFKGTFNGNGYTISGVTYSTTFEQNNDELLYIGLFGIIGENGVVKNLITKDFNIDLSNIRDGWSGEPSGNTNAGNIAGANYDGTIINCLNYSNIIGAKDSYGTGGIVGKNTGNIYYCKNTGDVKGYMRVGGIAGYSFGEWFITFSYNSGNISGGGQLGGIVGYAKGSKVNSGEEIFYNGLIENCINRGGVLTNGTSTGSQVGGIVGWNEETRMNKVTNKGNIVGENSVGGVVGDIYDTTVWYLLNFGGNVVATEEVLVGGIAGVAGDVKFYYCGNYDVSVNGSTENVKVNRYLYGAGGSDEKVGCYDQIMEQGRLDGWGEANIYIDDKGIGTDLTANTVNNFIYPAIVINAEDVENITSKDKVTYTFTSNQELTGFTASDITVTNGTKGTLSSAVKNSNGTYSYTMDVTTGNSGEMKVVLKDVSVYNARSIYNRGTIEKTIIIDKDGPNITFDVESSEVIKGSTLNINIKTTDKSKISYSWDNSNWEETKDFVTNVEVSKTFNEVKTYTLYAKATDEFGNEATNTLEIKVDDAAFNVTGNLTNWTKDDVVLKVESSQEIASVKVNDVVISGSTYTVKQNGTYKFDITDKLGNTGTKEVKVTKIDKDGPVIEDVKINEKEITIIAKDGKSGIKAYAVTTTTDEPINWSSSNKIMVENEGTFYVWVKDNVGNITKKADTVTVNVVTIPIYVNGNANGIIRFYQKNEDGKYVEIKDFTDKYLKINQTLRAEVEIGKYLYTGIDNGKEVKLSDILDKDGNVISEVSKDIYPAMKIGDYYFEPISAKQIVTERVTKLVYEFTLTNNKQEEVLNPEISIDFTKNKNNEDLYVYYSDSYTTFNTGNKITGIFADDINLHIDGIPYVKPEIYVQDKNSYERYKEGTEIIIKITSSEKLKDAVPPEIKVSFSESGLGQYNYQKDANKGNAKIIKAVTDENGNTVWTYSYIIQSGDEGIISFEYLTGSITDNAENIVDLKTFSGIEEINVYADTTAPTVKITLGEEVKADRTNSNIIKYVLTFSEKVIGFGEDDVIVNGGTKGKFEKINDTTYTIEVTTNVADGNQGEVQLIIENGACNDELGIKNIRTEKIVIVDKKAPEFIGLDISSNYKEGYKAGDKITIITKFDENVQDTENIPTLQLSFSESGKTRGILTEGTKAGNVIIYNYIISVLDKGDLIIKNLNGTVTDLVGNSTLINKNNLTVDGIIADNDVPKATIVYDKDKITNENVTAQITFNEEVIITNNEGKNTYVFTENGEFIFEFTDLAGNIGTAKAEVSCIDKDVPVATVKYTINKDGTVTAKVTFDEKDVIIKNNSGKDTYKFTKNGEFTFEFVDLAGNIGSVTAKVDNMSDTQEEKNPEIIFENLETIQLNGQKYVKVSIGMTEDQMIANMNKEALAGEVPEIRNTTNEGKLKTGSEIVVNGETKYVVIVKGDLNGDGKLTFMEDILMANNGRLGLIKLDAVQKLAADLNNNGTIEFMTEILVLNNYRLGIIKSI